MTLSYPSAVALAAALSLAACGDNLAAPAPDAGVDPDAAATCTAITLGARDLHFDLFGLPLGVRYQVATPLGGAPAESLLFELYDSTTPGLPPLAPGDFALGQAPDDNLATCQHCLWIPIDWDGASPLARVYLATEGTVTLTQVDDPLSVVFAGTTSAVVLREATVDETGATTLVNGGGCVRIEPLAVDTRPTPGQACLSAEDCGNPLLEVCSPATATCAEPECFDFGGCPAERPVCVIQYGDLLTGACYAGCDPAAAGGCAAGQTCQQFGVDPGFGRCLADGPGELGDACTVEDVSSSCVPGERCSAADGVCTSSCHFFDAAPGCQAGTQCNLFGVCESPGTADAATLGEPCSDGVELATGCAADGAAFRGLCFGFSPTEPLVCEEACFGELGCEPEEFCALRFGSGLGICLPDPVCGDGALGEIDETCDDGNTVSGDGCSADCQTVEYGPICTGAPPLAPDTTVTGTTIGAWDGFKASCQLGIARSETYRFTPPGRGRLRLTVGGASQHVVSLRRDCADADSELGCADNGSIPTSEVVHQVVDPAAPLTVVVSAYTVLEEGPFALQVEWTDESCGDGVVAGLEVCDDGNTASADGCRGDCRAIEYAVYCAAATPLAAGTTTAGNLTGAPPLFDSTCSNEIYGSGGDRLYRFTAPSAGRLRLTAGSDEALVALAVFDACGSPGSFAELACAPSFLPDPAEVTVTQGQTVTVLVEGFSPWETGAFTLAAELLPP